MEWYAIQAVSGKEMNLVKMLRYTGAEFLFPRKPMFARHKNSINLQYKPVMPGYIIAKTTVEDFYKKKHDLCFQGIMIRICGNWYDAVCLSQEDVKFYKACNQTMKPLIVRKEFGALDGSAYYSVLNPPPWAESAFVDWYYIDRFKAKFHFQRGGEPDRAVGEQNYSSFTVAAYSVDYQGKYLSQLQDLSK
jgi:hypothetical protein